MAYIPKTDSVIAYQGPGSVLSASVFGNVGASVIGLTPVAVTNNPSISGTVQTEQTGTRITSIVSTVPSSVLVGASIFGVVPISNANTISTNNSTTSTLTGDAVFTGTGDDVTDYASITITLDASHDSATNGMTFQFSTDNSNWDDVYNFTYTAANGARRFQFPVTAQYFRIVYTNGSTEQTHFRVQTILHRSDVGLSIHRLGSDTDPDRSAEVVKAALIAQVGGSGDFTPIQANAGGILKVGGSVDVDSMPTTSVIVQGIPQASVHGAVSVAGGSVSVENIQGASVSGTVNVANPVSVLSVTQGTDPWIITGSVQAATGNSSVQVLNFPANTSVSGAVTANQGTDPWIIKGSVQGTFNSGPVSGSSVVQQGTWRTSVISSTPSSMLVGASIFGLAPVNVTNTVTVDATGQGDVPVTLAGEAITITGRPSISGTVQVGNFPTTQNVSGSVAAFVQGKPSISGTVAVSNTARSVMGVVAPTGTVTSVVSKASTTALLAANANRRGAIVYNNTETSILVKLGNMASVNDSSFVMYDTDYFEVPSNYTGVLQHYASSVAGLIRVTEIT